MRLTRRLFFLTALTPLLPISARFTPQEQLIKVHTNSLAVFRYVYTDHTVLRTKQLSDHLYQCLLQKIE